MQIEVENMLRNITVVASLMPNDKLNTEEPLFTVYVPTSTRGAWRLWSGEHRETNISKVQSCVRQATLFVQTTMQNQVVSASFNGKMKAAMEVQHCKRTMDALEVCAIGLSNLAQTYRDDASIVAKIQMLRDEIHDFHRATNIALGDSSTIILRYDNTPHLPNP